MIHYSNLQSILQDTANVIQLDSLSRSINHNTISFSANQGLSQITDTFENAFDNILNPTQLDTLGDYLTVLNNHLETISNSLTTPSTVWGMSESLARILIPSIVSLGVFFAGLLIKAVSNRTRVKSFKKTILFWSEQLLKPIENQSNELHTFSQKLATTHELQGIELGKYQIPVEPLNSISLQKYLQAFRLATKERKDGLTKEKLKEGAATKGADYYTFGLFSQFSHLEEVHKRVFIEYEQYREVVKQYCDEWNGLFSPLKGILERIVNSGSLYVQPLASIINTFFSQDDGRIDIDRYEYQFIDPIYQWTLTNFSSSNNGPIHDAADYLMKLKQLIFRYRTTLQGYSNRFEDFSKWYENSHESIRNSVQYFEKASTRRFVSTF